MGWYQELQNQLSYFGEISRKVESKFIEIDHCVQEVLIIINLDNPGDIRDTHIEEYQETPTWFWGPRIVEFEKITSNYVQIER